MCPSESDVEEPTDQQSYCFCDQSRDCAPGNDVLSCPFELEGKRVGVSNLLLRVVCGMRIMKFGYNFGNLKASKFGKSPPKFEILIFHCICGLFLF